MGESSNEFAGKTVLITGAGKGLGKSYANWFAERGASVVVNNPARQGVISSARAVADAIVARGGRAIVDEHDVTDEAGAKAMVSATVEAFGHLDILICNAGIRPPAFGPLQDLSLADFRHVMDVNFYGTLFVLHAALPHLVAVRKPRVVATTSSAGFFASPTNTMYASSKTALIGLIRSVAAEGAEQGLRANLISPMAMTPMSEGDLDARYKSLLDPQHVAKVVGWLSSEACDLNGEILVAGGDTVYRATVVQTPGQRIGDGDIGARVPALRDLSRAQEVPNGMTTVFSLMTTFDTGK